MADMGVALSIAVFFIIWWLVLFAVLPFGVQTQEEANEIVPGTSESAPANFRLARVFLITTAVSLVMFAFVYWVTVTPEAKVWIDAFFKLTFGTAIFSD